MTTHAQAPPAQQPVKRKAPGFIQVTNDQLAMPMASRGHACDEERVSQFQKWVLLGIERLSWGGKKPCFATNLQIADAIGLTGPTDSLKRQLRIALHGRTYRKGRWEPETGKWKRDGELVKVPGLCDLALGFVEVRQAGPTAPRELVLTTLWLEWGRIRVFQDGNGEPMGRCPDPIQVVAPAIAAVSTAPPDGHTAPASPPSPVAPEAAERRSDPPAADPIVEHAPVPTELPSIVEPSAEPEPPPIEQPPPEVLAEVMGVHAGQPKPGQAWQLDELMRRRGVRWNVGEDGSLKYEVNLGYEHLNGSERSVIRWLKPELLALLKARVEKSEPPPKAGEPPGVESPAPKVVKPAEIRAMIGLLTGRPAPDDSDCRAIARRLVTDPGFAHHDADPESSEATYFGLARATKHGALPQVVMTEAFESACGAKVRNRGAMFVAEVKRLKAGLRGPDREGGPTS